MNNYQIKAAGENAELLVYGDIGEDIWAEESVSARSAVTQLQDINAGVIDVRINSYGGSVADGLAIYNALQRHDARVDVHVDGVAMSIASLIAMAGDSVNMAENAIMMIHAPWGMAAGNANDMREMADSLDTFAQAMASSYARKSGKSTGEIMDLLSDGEDHWYTATEAVEAGFADNVTDAMAVAAKYAKNRFTDPQGSPPAARVAAITQSEDKSMTEAKKPATDTVAVDEKEVAAQAIETERERIAQINATADKFDKRDMVADAVANGLSVEDFNARVLDVLATEKQKAATAPKPAPRSVASSVMAEPVYKHISKIKGFKTDADAYRSGMFIRAAIFGDEKARAWCRDNYPQAAMSEGVGTKGGFIVPDEFSQAIIDLREQYGVARQLATVRQMGSDTLTIPRRTGGLTAYYVGENTAVTASDKAWDQVNLVARKLAVLAKYSSELAEDAIIDVASDLASEIAYAFAAAEDDALINGDGTSTYGGIYGFRPKLIDGNYAAGAVDAASGNDTYAEITLADLHGMMAALPQYASNNAMWLASKPACDLVFDRLNAAAGGNTIASLEAGGARRQFLGYDIVVSQKMPTSTGDLSNVAMILFGDFSLASTMGDRRMITIREDASRYLEYDQIAILGTERFDAVVHDLGDGTTAGPVVGLIGE